MAHYGSFRNVRNYLVLAGNPSPELEERCGYYGERLLHLEALSAPAAPSKEESWTKQKHDSSRT